MAFDDAAVRQLFDSLVSHAQTLGIFQTVNSHEPKSAPVESPWCSIWVQNIRPANRVSGLAMTSGVVELRARIGMSFMQKPEDTIDPRILAAVTTLMAEYSGNFTLDGTVLAIDLLGMAGTALSAQAGYIVIDQKHYRVMECTVPIIIDDLFEQVA